LASGILPLECVLIDLLRGVESRSQAGSLGEQACDRGHLSADRPGVGRDGWLRRRQSRSSRAVPRVSGCRATANATDADPNPTSLGGPTRHQTSQILSGYPTTPGNGLSWHSPRVRRLAQTLGFPRSLRLWRPPQPAKPSDCWPSWLETPPRADSVPATARSLPGA
jgi:hypothetical protein